MWSCYLGAELCVAIFKCRKNRPTFQIGQAVVFKMANMTDEAPEENAYRNYHNISRTYNRNPWKGIYKVFLCVVKWTGAKRKMRIYYLMISSFAQLKERGYPIFLGFSLMTWGRRLITPLHPQTCQFNHNTINSYNSIPLSESGYNSIICPVLCCYQSTTVTTSSSFLDLNPRPSIQKSQ